MLQNFAVPHQDKCFNLFHEIKRKMHKRGVAHLSWAVRRAAVNTLSALFGARDRDWDSHITNPLAVLGSLFETWSPVSSVLLRAICCGTQVLLSY